MKVYFSHPTFTYNTKTESRCIEIIKEAFKDSFGSVDVINPSKFGLRINPVNKLKEADKIVGMAISDKMLYLVWKEIELAENFEIEAYVFYVENKDDLGPLVEGVPKNIEKLSKDESRIFSNKMLKGKRDSFISSFIGNWGGRF